MKFICLLIAVVLFFSCSNKPKTVDPAVEASAKPASDSVPAKEAVKTVDLTQEQMDLMGVVLGKPQKRSLEGTVTANGKVTILANSMADVSAVFKGIILKIAVKEGQLVKKGDVIVEMVSPDLIQFQEDYRKASSELYYLEKELQRQQTLSTENVGAAKNLQDVQSKVYFQQAIIKSTTSKLALAGLDPKNMETQTDGSGDKILVRAPIGGYISRILITIGTDAAEGAKLAHISDINDLHADIAVFEKDLQKIKKGQVVRIKFADPSIPETTGKVEFINKEIDPASRVAIARAAFIAPPGALILPEMQLTATVETQSALAWSVPDAAAMKDENGQSFFYYLESKNKDGKFSFKRSDLDPKSQVNGFYRLPDEYSDKMVVVKGVNIMNGESKRSEAE